MLLYSFLYIITIVIITIIIIIIVNINIISLENRSMGVLTKLDMRNNIKTLIDALSNEGYPLALGYIGVRCRNNQELETGTFFLYSIMCSDKVYL